MPLIRRPASTASRVGLACLTVVVLLGAAFSPTPAPAGRPVVPSPGPVAPPPSFAEVGLPTGVRMRYAVQGSPTGQPVILLHGYSDSWFSWSRVLPLFPANLRVYALDLRGHGGTSRPETGYRLADMAGDVLAFLDAQGIPRTAVVGHSMGSLVAQHVAARAPGRVSRLVLVGSTPVVSEELATQLGEALEAMDGSVSEEFAREFQASTIFHPVPDEFFREVVATSLSVPLPVWKALLIGFSAPGSGAELARISTPTLLLWGTRDAYSLRADQDALLAGIAGSRLLPYAETGHAPHWERPEQFARDAVEFIAVP
ncbi:MAG: alpha/beta fold hydrolase [Gemmatimonadales bacterium]